MKKLLKNFFRKRKLNRIVKDGKKCRENGTVTDKVSAYIYILSRDKKISRKELFECSMKIFDEQQGVVNVEIHL